MILRLDNYTPPFLSLQVRDEGESYSLEGTDQSFAVLDYLPESVVFNDVEYRFDKIEQNSETEWTIHYCL